jgi:hypothetical protein
MNGLAPETASWFTRRPGWTIAMLVLLQGGFIWLLDGRWPMAVRPLKSSTAFHLLAGTRADETLATMWRTADPTLFALVSAHSFSGPVWLSYPRMTHRLVDWVEPPQWLAPRVDQLGAGFGESSRIQTRLPPVATDKPLPRLAELEVASTPVAKQSTVRVEGALAARPLVATPALPVWSGTEILTNSEVQVMVGEDGKVFSPPVLLVGCGLKVADEAALELARLARFQPAPTAALNGDARPESYTWGRLVFQWATQEAVGTNLPPGRGP